MLASCIPMYICMYVYGVYMCRSSLTVHQLSLVAFGTPTAWVNAVVSPVLFIVMFTKGILMALKTNIFKKFFITHILTVIVSFDIHTQMQ